VDLDAMTESRFMHGQSVAADAIPGPVKVYGASGRFLGLGEGENGILSPKRLFN
jgi:hypothetical protein